MMGATVTRATQPSRDNAEERWSLMCRVSLMGN